MKNIHALSLLSLVLIFTLSSLRATPDAGVCKKTGASGSCGPYLDSQITESNGFNTYVLQDVWNPDPGWKQKLYATNPGNWYVIANFSLDSSGAIHTYPDTQQLYNGELLTDFHNMYSSFSETADHSSDTVGDYGYDIWLNNWSTEVMIQHDVVNIPQCDGGSPVAGPIRFGGTNGVPVLSWYLCQNGSELIWQLPSGGSNTFGMTSGSVDILSMLNWLAANGYLPTDSTVTAIDYGFEISSTNSKNKTFKVTMFTLTQN